MVYLQQDVDVFSISANETSTTTQRPLLQGRYMVAFEKLI